MFDCLLGVPFLWYNRIMRTDYIKPSAYKKIYPIMQYENALALRTSLETGMRIGDVLDLEKNQLQGRRISFTAQKTGKSAKKVISVDLAKRLRQVSGSRWIFEGRYGDKPRRRQTVWKDVKKACKELRITENVGCHSARKTYAVEELHEHGLPTVQKELQHDRLSTTMLYAFSDLLTADVTKSCDNGVDVQALGNYIIEGVCARILPKIEEIGQNLTKK